MRIAICDDEEQFRAGLRALITKLIGDLDPEINSFHDGHDLLAEFDRKPYDIVFLDIEMPEMDGITLARTLRSRSSEVLIVFLTGHVEYAIEGYEVNALRYLTKPVTTEIIQGQITLYAIGLKYQRKITYVHWHAVAFRVPLIQSHNDFVFRIKFDPFVN